MLYKMLGRTGLSVSSLCLGSATFGVAPDAASAAGLVARAVDLGMNFFDTANSYGNQARFDRPGAPKAPNRPWAEELLGAALGRRRDDVVLASKVSEPVGDGPNSGSWVAGGLTRKHVIRQLETSLQRLQTDYLDIYHVHHPDAVTEVDEWLSTMDDLVAAGKIRHYGLSTFGGWQLTEVVLRARLGGSRAPACLQTRYSVLDRWIERDVLPAAAHFDVPVTVFSPLAGGLLTSSYGRSVVGDARWGGPSPTPVMIEAAGRFHALAREWALPPEALALAWLRARESVASIIVGPESVGQLEQLAAAAATDLNQQQLMELDLLVDSPAPFWST